MKGCGRVTGQGETCHEERLCDGCLKLEEEILNHNLTRVKLAVTKLQEEKTFRILRDAEKVFRILADTANESTQHGVPVMNCKTVFNACETQWKRLSDFRTTMGE